MDKSKTLFIPTKVLQGYGCKTCAWKTFGQCPKGFTKPEESVEEGYCEELAKFIFSLAEGEDSISAVKEKYHLYVAEMQSQIDHFEFNKLLKEYREARESGADPKDLAKMQFEIQGYRLWWERLNATIIKGLGKVVDREQKVDDKTLHIDHKISLNQIHQLANAAIKEIGTERKEETTEP